MAIVNGLKDSGALDSRLVFDVCIIGSGPAGTVLGKTLVEHGVRTVIVESGQSLIRWFLDPRVKQLAAYETEGDTCYPTKWTKARAIGGNSNFWTGRTERLHPLDFENNAYTPEGNPWPITYSEIEPYYELSEQTLRVRGGKLSIFHAPRRNDFPISPGPNISRLRSMMAGVGLTVDDSPTATPKYGWRFFRVSKEILPDFLASSNGVLVSGKTITRLIVNAKGYIVGVEGRAMDGSKDILRAKYYVVSCGGIESPRLLLLSRSDTFPNGIGNRYDRVGRFFSEHPGLNFYGKIPHRFGTLRPSHKIGRCHQYYDDFKRKGLGGVIPVFIQSLVFPNHLMTTRMVEIPKMFIDMLRRMEHPELFVGAAIEMLPRDSNRVTLSKNRRDRFGNPLAHLSFNYNEEDNKTLDCTRALIRNIYKKLGTVEVTEREITWSRHHIGTCMMGDNAKTSVVDRNLRVHESPNLYVCGSEVFVTGGAVPPVLTITALAHRLAEHLISRLENE